MVASLPCTGAGLVLWVFVGGGFEWVTNTSSHAGTAGSNPVALKKRPSSSNRLRDVCSPVVIHLCPVNYNLTERSVAVPVYVFYLVWWGSLVITLRACRYRLSNLLICT